MCLVLSIFPHSQRTDLILHVIPEIVNGQLFAFANFGRLMPEATVVRNARGELKSNSLNAQPQPRLTCGAHESTLSAEEMDIRTGEPLPKKPVDLGTIYLDWKLSRSSTL
jgi:hypothetical protein